MNPAIDQRTQLGPVPLARFDHVSVPCRDLEEATCFFVDVLGGELRVSTPIFAEVRLGGTLLGFGAVGTTFMRPARNIRTSASWSGRPRSRK